MAHDRPDVGAVLASSASRPDRRATVVVSVLLRSIFWVVAVLTSLAFVLGVVLLVAADMNPFGIFLIFALVTAGLGFGSVLGALGGLASGVVVSYVNATNRSVRLMSGLANGGAMAVTILVIGLRSSSYTPGDARIVPVAAAFVLGFIVGTRLSAPAPATT